LEIKNMKAKFYGAAAAAMFVLSGAASAQTAATATTDLNMRSGPGPQHPVIGHIGANAEVTVNGCMEGSKWCTVSFNGMEGWAYSDYLTASVSGSPVIITGQQAQIGIPVATYDATETGAAAGTLSGAAAGAIGGALIGGPLGAAVGGVAGATAGGLTGAAAGAIIDPPAEVRTYVTANQMEPVFLEGEVVVGAAIPEPVVLQPIPDYDYSYAYVNGQAVLVEPTSRQIVYIVR
jgi:uncharacterized protein YraI